MTASAPIGAGSDTRLTVSHGLQSAAAGADPLGVSPLSARRLTCTVLILVVASVLAVFWLAPTAGAAGGPGGVEAQSAGELRPSPVISRERKAKAPRALPKRQRGERSRRAGKARRVNSWVGG
jgi:hypothetical protein